MKKPALILAAAFLFCSCLSFAGTDKPDLTLKWGPEFRLPKKHYELSFIGNTKDGFVMLSHRRATSLSLQRFDGNLKMTGENLISLKMMPKGYMSEAVWNMNKKNYWFYSTWSKSDPKERLYAQELDMTKGDFKGAAKELVTASDKIAGVLVATGFYQFNTSDKWKFVRSADSTKLMVYYRLKPKVKKDAKSYDLLGFYVYDENLNKLWGSEIEMPYTEKVMDNEDYQVDKDGNAYLLAKVWDDDRKDKDARYHYEVMKFTKGSSKPAIASFRFTDKYVVDIAMTEDRTGRMICTGYYSKSPKSRSADGAFLLTFDEATMATKNVFKGFYEFPTETIKQFESARTRKKMDKAEDKGKEEEVGNLQFRNMRVADDGSITLFGEQYYSVTVSYYDGKSWHTRTTYYYQDIYGMKIGADGEMKWVKKIPKNQTGSTTRGLGYFLRSDGNDNYLFFVDNAKNMNLQTDQAPAAHVAGAGGLLVCVKVADDGKTTKNSIFDFREEKTVVEVKEFKTVSANQIIGRGTSRKDSKPLLISMK